MAVVSGIGAHFEGDIKAPTEPLRGFLVATAVAVLLTPFFVRRPNFACAVVTLAAAFVIPEDTPHLQ